MKRTFYVLALFLFAINLYAQKTILEEIREDQNVSGGGYYAYPYPQHPLPRLTPAPKGYKPFYISHYGRHGSRWLHDTKLYKNSVETLNKADRYGKLTARGQEVLVQLRQILEESKGRIGELTPVGARQHAGIAQRMTKNFPEIFKGEGVIDCKSSVVMRCALSMLNEVKEFQAFNPRLRISADASQADMWYLVYGNEKANELERRARDNEIAEYRSKHMHLDHFLHTLFTDQQFVQDSLDVKNFISNMAAIISNQQSHDTDVSFWDLFDEQELLDNFLCENAFWYVVRSSSPITQSYMPHLAENLLRNIIESADKAISDGKCQAHLRFGHDACLMPLVSLMNVGNYGAVIDDLEDLTSRNWLMHHVIPMAGNLQLIFYRKKNSDDILVKALLCENEVTFPVQTDLAPYYHWSDVRDYYLKMLQP